MDITIDGKDFKNAINWVTKGFDTSNDRGYVVLSLDKDGHAFLAHRSETSYMKSSLQLLSADIDDELKKGEDSIKLTLNGSYLMKLAKVIDERDAIKLHKDDDKKSQLEGSSSKSSYTIPLVDLVNSERIFKEPDFIRLGTVNNFEWFDSLIKNSELTDEELEQMQAQFAAVHLFFDDKSVIMASTDRYVAGERRVDFVRDSSLQELPDGVKDTQLLLRKHDAKIIGIDKGNTDDVTIIFNKDNASFGYEFSDGRIAVFQLVDAQPIGRGVFEQFKKNLDKKAGSINIVKDSMVREYNNIKQLAFDENIIVFTIDKSILTIADITGSNTGEITIKYNGEFDSDFELKFDRKELDKAFKQISSSQFEFTWNEEKNNVMIVPILDDETKDKNSWTLIQVYIRKDS